VNRPVRRSKGRFVITGPAATNQAVRQTTLRAWFHDQEKNEATTTQVSFCACCQVVLGEQNTGGVCVACSQVICLECAKTRCDVCHGIVCDNGNCCSKDRGKVICNNHGWIATAIFVLRNGL
jgi:hypothetical protein